MQVRLNVPVFFCSIAHTTKGREDRFDANIHVRSSDRFDAAAQFLRGAGGRKCSDNACTGTQRRNNAAPDTATDHRANGITGTQTYGNAWTHA